ncbi:MAG: DNA-processing protein DprA [Clostridia bacterium]|nr:DNA-processing protein DprA [Clostridia bacterium]
MEDLRLWLWYVLAMGNHKALARKLYTEVGSVKKIYEYTKSDYAELGVKDERKMESLCDKSFDKADNAMWFADKYGVEFIPIDSEAYPHYLKNIYDPPLVIYKRGVHFAPENELYIAMVGTRKPSNYGKEVAFSLARDLASAGVTVVSGMATGIDSECHKGCLDAGGFTTAVLGTGVNTAYPKSNVELMRRIMNSGAVVSEYGFDEPSFPGNFAARNRIISGLCAGTIIVEAGEGSGALITANLALDQSRDLFAVPGNVNAAVSAGANSLLKSSAKMVTDVADILEEYQAVYPHLIKTGTFAKNSVEFEIPKEGPASTNIENAVIACLKEGPKRLDAIVVKTRVPVANLNGTLTLMELQGKVVQDKFGNYSIAKL